MAGDSSTNRIQETRQGHLKQGNGQKKSERLFYGCTSTGKKEGSTNSNFIVGISFRKGVVLCEQCFGPITRTKFAHIVDSSFHSAFENSINPRAVARIGGLVFKITPRSPDLNPTEKVKL